MVIKQTFFCRPSGGRFGRMVNGKETGGKEFKMGGKEFKMGGKEFSEE